MVLISAFTNDIYQAAGWSKSVKRDRVEREISEVFNSMDLSPAQWCSYDAIVYGLEWYVKTGRATVEIENELKSLSARVYVRLVVRMYLDKINVSGDVGQWLRTHAGNYKRLAMN